jgi:signal transduction histidine kinase
MDEERLKLREAFEHFELTSGDLIKHFRQLKEKVEVLTRELEKKNRRIRYLEAHAERNKRLSAMGDMAMTLAHKLRNPLGTISIYSSLLERELIKDRKNYEAARQISNEVKRLDLIISNLLIFTRNLSPVLKSISVHKYIRRSIENAHSLIESNEIELSLGLEAKRDVIEGDGELLRQLFLNLILNSIQAMKPGGRLEITTCEVDGAENHDLFRNEGQKTNHQLSIRKDLKGGDPHDGRIGQTGEFARSSKGEFSYESSYLMVRISDNGIGMEGKVLERIFDPFYTTKSKGTGLGLCIAHNVVESHGGVLEIHSEPSRGTDVFIYLPYNRE